MEADSPSRIAVRWMRQGKGERGRLNEVEPSSKMWLVNLYKTTKDIHLATELTAPSKGHWRERSEAFLLKQQRQVEDWEGWWALTEALEYTMCAPLCTLGPEEKTKQDEILKEDHLKESYYY